MSDHLSPEEIAEILENHTKQLLNLSANNLDLAAKIDGLETMVAFLGKTMGLDPHGLVANLRITQATAQQKRLQQIEDKNPTLAAHLANLVTNLGPADYDLADQMDMRGFKPTDDQPGS